MFNNSVKCRAVHGNFKNNEQKLDEQGDVCEIVISLLVVEIQDFESEFRFFVTPCILYK